MNITVNGEPVPETAGDPVRWEDVPDRHAHCDGEIRRLRELLNEARIAEPAVATAGTEHVVQRLLDDRYPDGPVVQPVQDR